MIARDDEIRRTYISAPGSQPAGGPKLITTIIIKSIYRHLSAYGSAHITTRKNVMTSFHLHTDRHSDITALLTLRTCAYSLVSLWKMITIMSFGGNKRRKRFEPALLQFASYLRMCVISATNILRNEFLLYIDRRVLDAPEPPIGRSSP